MDMFLLLISDKDAPPAKKSSEQSPVKDPDDDDDDEAPPPVVAPRPQHTKSVSEDFLSDLSCQIGILIFSLHTGS